jgi:predicted transcriptional regulator
MEQNQEAPQSHRKRRKPLTTEEKQKAADLVQKGLTHDETAKLLNAERSAITKAIQPYLLGKEALEIDKKNEANIWLDLSMRHARAITDEDIKKAPVNVKMTNAAIAYDKYRLATGQSTDNVSIITTLVQSLRESHNANDND